MNSLHHPTNRVTNIDGPKQKRKVLPVIAVIFCLACKASYAQAKFVKKIPWAEQGVWLKADTHIHSSFSDGEHTITEIASNAIKFGCDLIAVTDHSDRNLKGASFEYEQQITIARRTFPNLLILSGIEWNIPPFDGDVHISVLISPGPHEFDILREFKKRFDDYQREEHSDGLAKEALIWLEEITNKAESTCVLILNHPSRKLSDTSEVYEMMEQWRGVNDLIVGFEGSPGHQKTTPIGSYKGKISTQDGWDPAVIQPGNAWDKLLLQGHDIWGVSSNSDFHNTNLDYWPGEFSETWIYAPNRTSQGALAALKAGSFFGVQGHIAKEALLTVWATGLGRPAYPGEVISVPEGELIFIKLNTKIPSNDFKGDRNYLNELSIITNRNNDSSKLSQEQISLTSGNLESRTIVPPEGFTIRGMGRRMHPNRGNLLFLTNPIRVEASSKYSESLFSFTELKGIWQWTTLFLFVTVFFWSIRRSFSRRSLAKRNELGSQPEKMSSSTTPKSPLPSELDVDWTPPIRGSDPGSHHSSLLQNESTGKASDTYSKPISYASFVLPFTVIFSIWLLAVVIANSPLMHTKFKLSYNIQELLDRSPVLVISVLVAFLACIGFASAILTEIWMTRPNLAVAVLPISFSMAMTIVFILMSVIIPEESIQDVLGAPTISAISPFLELLLRFIASASAPFISLLIGSRLSKGKFLKSELSALIAVSIILVIAEMFVIHWTETDNITEILNLDEPLVFRLSFLGFFIYCGMFAQCFGRTLSRPHTFHIVRSILLMTIGIPFCWWLTFMIFESDVHKYGHEYSGLQFLLSPSREEIQPIDSLFPKFVSIYLLSNLIIGTGFSLGESAIAATQKVITWNSGTYDSFSRKDGLSARSVQYAHHMILTGILVYLIVIIVGSLVPLNFIPQNFEKANERYLSILKKPVDFSLKVDWITNVLLFIPFSFMLMGRFSGASSRSKLLWGSLIVCICCGLSATIEYIQIWFPPRVVSKNDIIAETIGAVIGVLAWSLFGKSIVRFLLAIIPSSIDKNPAGKILLAYCVFILFYSVMPLDLTIDPSQLHDKYKMGRFELIPFSFLGRQLGYRFFSLLVDFLVYIPLGILLQKMKGPASQRSGSLGFVAKFSLIIVLISEAIQVFVFSRNVGVSDCIFAVAGSMLGASLTNSDSNSLFSKISKIPNSTLKIIVPRLLFISIYASIYIYFSVGDVGPKFTVDLMYNLSGYWNIFDYWSGNESTIYMLLFSILHLMVLIPIGFVVSDITVQFENVFPPRVVFLVIVVAISFLISFIELFQGYSKNLTPLFLEAVFLILGFAYGMSLRAKLSTKALQRLNLCESKNVSTIKFYRYAIVGILGLAAFSYRHLQLIQLDDPSHSAPLRETFYPHHQQSHLSQSLYGTSPVACWTTTASDV